MSGLYSELEKYEPNYDDTVEEVFTKATFAFIGRTGTGKSPWRSDLFYFWANPSASPYLPSWVKDFTDISTACDRMFGDRYEFLDASDNFNASAGACKQIRRNGSHTLGIADLLCDEIDEISQFPLARSPEKSGYVS